LIEAAVTRIFLKLSRDLGISGVTGLSCANLSKFCKTFVDVNTFKDGAFKSLKCTFPGFNL